MENNKEKIYSDLITVFIWGGLWGIFESTAGYILHLLPFRISWLVWYPAACFFMANVYFKTRKIYTVVFIGVLAASVKMVNLLLPGSIDRVINPAISIVFEAFAMAFVIYGVKYFKLKKTIIAALSMNTIWRILYVLYILYIVPNWMREISVISSGEKFIMFFAIHNLITSLILYIGRKYMNYISGVINTVENKVLALFSTLPQKACVAAFLFCAGILLELLL